MTFFGRESAAGIRIRETRLRREAEERGLEDSKNPDETSSLRGPVGVDVEELGHDYDGAVINTLSRVPENHVIGDDEK